MGYNLRSSSRNPQNVTTMKKAQGKKFQLKPSPGEKPKPPHGYQRRNFTLIRQKKAREYSERAANQPWYFGTFRSEQWYDGILSAINEPGVIVKDNVLDWMQQHSSFFETSPPQQNPAIRWNRTRWNGRCLEIARIAACIKVETEDEDVNTAGTWSDELFEYLQLERPKAKTDCSSPVESSK